jgi:fructokinase
MLGPKMADLTLHSNENSPRTTPALVVLGEILWDVFSDSVSLLGGAPLNFSVHAKRLGLHPILISALGADELGRKAAAEIRSTGLDMSFIRESGKWATGTASVAMDGDGHPAFRIARPAAYDDLDLNAGELARLRQMQPAWIYFGTLFASSSDGHATLRNLLQALPQAGRFYDVNLRPGAESLQLVEELLGAAGIVKLNETEAEWVSRRLDLPSAPEAFCREGSRRFGWRAACITLGESGCAMLVASDFVQAPGVKVKVADTVGAGDAFAAAFVYGLSQHWPAADIAQFANRVGALVASRAGAIPDWSILEAVTA